MQNYARNQANSAHLDSRVSFDLDSYSSNKSKLNVCAAEFVSLSTYTQTRPLLTITFKEYHVDKDSPALTIN